MLSGGVSLPKVKKAIAPTDQPRVVAASFVALTLSGAPIFGYTQSIFLAPMTAEFGWSRSTYFLPMTIGGLLGAVAIVIVGGLSDRQGVRPWILGSVVAFGLTTLGLGAVNGFAFYSLFIVASIVSGSGHGPALYSKAISEWATPRPGLAVAIGLAGAAFGGVVTPGLTVWLVGAAGWRVARALLGGLVLLVALPVVWRYIRPPPPEQRSRLIPVSVDQSTQLTAGEVLRSRRFAQLMVGVFTASLGVNAILTNLSVVMTDRGYNGPWGGIALSAYAVAQVLGRLLSGAALDRFNTPKVGSVWFLIGIPGILLLGWGANPIEAVVGAMLVGMGLGADLQLASYYALRFFGLPHFGKIIGASMGVFVVGSSVAPMMLARSHDLTGDNRAGLIAAICALAIASLMFLTLGRYRFAVPKQIALVD